MTDTVSASPKPHTNGLRVPELVREQSFTPSKPVKSQELDLKHSSGEVLEIVDASSTAQAESASPKSGDSIMEQPCSSQSTQQNASNTNRSRPSTPPVSPLSPPLSPISSPVSPLSPAPYELEMEHYFDIQTQQSLAHFLLSAYDSDEEDYDDQIMDLPEFKRNCFRFVANVEDRHNSQGRSE
ncbi:hypothetical protein EX30DRAFT_339368 [Ascodesmis nigricans]|uniref:Uncharacterized protein n=1 Tax=Ascodesmis nigricans TaxID=341454 RepID=A0A4S2N239_9PEZI|nr:hypothetical protein EX30DRAFT_339368 [Ascodesmis nigricans]